MTAIPHAGVIVTGAGGRTGKIVVRKLLVDSRRDDGTFAYRVCAVVRSGEEKLLSYLRENESCFVDSAVETGSLIFANIDITSEAAEAQLTETFQKLGSDGSVGLVVCSSAVPKINMSSLFGVIFWNKLLGYKDVRPTFHFKEAAQEPKSVDYEGQLRQFSAARASGVSTHVVVVSSMAGTDPSHFLNQNMQNMVLWKRKAEKALVEAGDLPYTIIHPGGLLPHVGTSKDSDKGGERALVVSVDDSLLQREYRLIPREDVAELCVLCLKDGEASKNRSFDVVAEPVGTGSAFDGELKQLLGTLDGANADYSKPDLSSL